MFRHLTLRFSKAPNRFRNINKNIPNALNVCVRNPQLYEKKTDRISSSTIVAQDGLNFNELPLTIKKSKSLNLSDETIENKVDDVVNFNFHEIKTKLEECNDLDAIFNVLEEIDTTELTASIAKCALIRITDLYNNFGYRNMGLNAIPEQNSISTPKRKTVLLKLCETICESKNLNTVLKGLESAIRVEYGFEENNFLSDKFISECLLRICDGKANISNIIEFASLVIASRSDSRILDQLWSFISDRYEEIDNTNLADVYNILPALKSSRRTVFITLEKRTFALWWQLRVSDVSKILSVLVRINLRPQNLLLSLSKWVNLHIHAITESELEEIVSNFEKLDYIHPNFETTIQRYVKVRNIQIKNPSLVAAIMSYCQYFKLQSNVILDSIARYFVANAFEIPPKYIGAIVKPFGVLNYVPNTELKFYKVLEDVIVMKFVDFRPEDLIELLLTCTYVQRYPLNFVRKIFSPYFLDRLSSLVDTAELEKARQNLQLLDMAMTLECERYSGPLLPRERQIRGIRRNERLTRIIDKISEVMSEFLGGYKYFYSNKWLHQYPLSETYIVDFLIHFDRNGNVIPVEEKAKVEKRKILLILMPEHYCRGKQNITGPQSAKIRLLEKLGYEVIRVDFEDLSVLYNKPIELSALIKHKLLNF